jgi:hypothetical protein
VHSLAILSVGFLSWLPTQCAQNPFQFPEAWLLEHRIEVTRSGEEYDPAHSGELLSGGSPCISFLRHPRSATAHLCIRAGHLHLR